ncbi:MAG TPA: lytic transglycosylase, partial [Methyloradius sp.]|nr:lytic transglycosylase [Methyloradius sp.]
MFKSKKTLSIASISKQALLIAMAIIALSPSSVLAMSDEALFQHARESYSGKNEIALGEDVAQLKSQEYILAPYADYWFMLLKLDHFDNSVDDNAEAQAFLNKYVDLPFADRLRGEWLKKLGKQQNWPLFFEQYASFKRDDPLVQCFALLGHSQLEDMDIASQVKALWMTTADLPGNCNQVFDIQQKKGVLTTDDIWARFRMALQEGKLPLAKSVAVRLPIDNTSLKLLDRAYQSPQTIIDKKTVSTKSRFGMEVNLFAIDRLARTKLDNAVSSFRKAQNTFDVDNRAFAWGRIAYHAARAHSPEALDLYMLAGSSHLDREQLAWKARAALREQDWSTVQAAIADMQPKQQEESAWRYWKARALREQGQVVEANAIFSQLSKERHYYGWLAAEELESVM